MGNQDDWVVSDDIKQIKVLKPPYRSKAGQLKANRRLSQGEKKKTFHHCSSYGGQSHNRLTCKYIMPAPSIVNRSGFKSRAKGLGD